MRASLKTLIVDDNATNLKILERTLKHHFSHLVDMNGLVQAKDGFEALDAYNNDTFDMILCDIDMPGMSGVQVARHIRQQDTEVIFIACTTSDSPSARELYNSTGMDGCVCKPLDLIELNDNITTALQARQSLWDVTGSPDTQQRYLIHRNSVSRTSQSRRGYTHEPECHRTDKGEAGDLTLLKPGGTEDPLSTVFTTDEDREVDRLDLSSLKDLPQAPPDPIKSITPCACIRLCAEVKARLSYNLNLGTYFTTTEIDQLQNMKRTSALPQKSRSVHTVSVMPSIA